MYGSIDSGFAPADDGVATRRTADEAYEMISALDTHETVKSVTAAGFTNAQAEALTAAVKQALDVDLSNIATKTEIVDLRREITGVALRLIKWLVGIGVPATLTVGGMIWTATQVVLRALHA